MSLRKVGWENNPSLVYYCPWLSSLSSTGLTSGSPCCSMCLYSCTPQPIPLPPPTTLLRDQPSPTVRSVASTDDVTTHARRAGTTRHLHGVLKQHRRRRRRRSTGLSTRKAERRRRRVHSRYHRQLRPLPAATEAMVEPVPTRCQPSQWLCR